eukprot:4734103-Pleurochrysis_carterae.AAC.1
MRIAATPGKRMRDIKSETTESIPERQDDKLRHNAKRQSRVSGCREVEHSVWDGLASSRKNERIMRRE